MMKATSRFLFFLLALAVSLTAMAQGLSFRNPPAQTSDSARQLISIKVTGSKRYPEAAIAAATGLRLGTPVGDDDFKKAARRLGDTGVFSDIGYKFSYSSAGTKLELQVTDAPKFVPARFEDFVWFSDDELLRRIKEYDPLFDGELPLSGKLPDHVSDVLQAMLVERGIAGNVEYLRFAKQDGPIEAILYKVSDVLIQVRNMEFAGAAEAEIPALKAAAKRLPDNEYARSRLNLLVQKQLLPVYYARGFLKAAFGEPQPTVVKMPTAATEEGPRNQTLVDVTFAVTPGLQYKVKSLEWSGNKEFPTEQLQKMVHAQAGQPANTVRLADDLKTVQTLYGTRGFITATIKVDAEFDDATSSAVLHLDVREGYAYHMGELEFRGLDNALMGKLRSAWKLRPGDVYDAGYLVEYLKAAQKLLPPSLDWEVSSHVTGNQRDKTVDVDLIYSVKAPK
jgi:outer membrane protein insertion porin family